MVLRIKRLDNEAFGYQTKDEKHYPHKKLSVKNFTYLFRHTALRIELYPRDFNEVNLPLGFSPLKFSQYNTDINIMNHQKEERIDEKEII